jgi:uncharacterized membrane protein YccC
MTTLNHALRIERAYVDETIRVASSRARPARQRLVAPRRHHAREVLLDPRPQRREVLGHLGAHLRERVLHARRNLREHRSLHEAIFFEHAQRLSEHLLAHASDPSTQLAEAVRPAAKHEQHQRAPAARDVIEHHARGALRGVEVADEHLWLPCLHAHYLPKGGYW